jgi:hypothetical protein
VLTKLRHEVDAHRFTGLDRTLIGEVNAERVIDLRAGAARFCLDHAHRSALMDRLKKLEQLGLAWQTGVGTWSLSSRMEPTLAAMGDRSDRIEAIQSVLEQQRITRAVDTYVIHRAGDPALVGRVISAEHAADGAFDDHHHLVVDGVDGRVHLVEVADAVALAGLRRGHLVEVRSSPVPSRNVDRLKRPTDRTACESIETPAGPSASVERTGQARRTSGSGEQTLEKFARPDGLWDSEPTGKIKIVVRLLSAIDLKTQVIALGATWLDQQLIARQQIRPVPAGFGLEVARALQERRTHLVQRGFAEQVANGGIRYRRDLIAALARLEIMETGQKLARKGRLTFRLLANGDRFSGTFRTTLQLVSGRYALIENAHEFALLPWRPEIETASGRNVAGLIRGLGVSWELRSRRGLGL